jgi:hypothetical protein
MKTPGLLPLFLLSGLSASLLGQTKAPIADSDEAKAHYAMGWTVYMGAKSADDFTQAAAEFGDAQSLAANLGLREQARINRDTAAKEAGKPLEPRPALLGQPNQDLQPGFTLRLEVPDPIPAGARDAFATGETLFKGAKSADDLAKASDAFVLALSLAPNWLEARYNNEFVKEAIRDTPSKRGALLFEQANPYVDSLVTKPEPVIPEEARSHFIMGVTLFKGAKVPDDFSKATAEFEQAVQLSPDWSDARYNLILAKEAFGDFAGAERELMLYLQLPLYSSERRTAMDKLYEIQAKQK